jgi:hypothetical protein
VLPRKRHSKADTSKVSAFFFGRDLCARRWRSSYALLAPCFFFLRALK